MQYVVSFIALLTYSMCIAHNATSDRIDIVHFPSSSINMFIFILMFNTRLPKQQQEKSCRPRIFPYIWMFYISDTTIYRKNVHKRVVDYTVEYILIVDVCVLRGEIYNILTNK